MKVEELTREYSANNKFPFKVAFVTNAVNRYSNELQCLLDKIEEAINDCESSVEFTVSKDFGKDIRGFVSLLRMLGYATIIVKGNEEYYKRKEAVLYTRDKRLKPYRVIVSLLCKTDEKELEYLTSFNSEDEIVEQKHDTCFNQPRGRANYFGSYKKKETIEEKYLNLDIPVDGVTRGGLSKLLGCHKGFGKGKTSDIEEAISKGLIRYDKEKEMFYKCDDFPF